MSIVFQSAAKASLVFHHMLSTTAPQLIRDRELNLNTYHKCCVGSELVDWLMSTSRFVHTRPQSIGIWQAMLEGKGLSHGNIANNLLPSCIKCITNSYSSFVKHSPLVLFIPKYLLDSVGS